VRLRHTLSFCSSPFLFGLSPLTTLYISPVVAISPLRQGLKQSPLLPSRLRRPISASVSVAHIPLSVSSARCGLSSVCLPLGVFLSPLGVFPLGVFPVARCVSPVARLYLPPLPSLGTNPPVPSQYMLSTWWFHVQNTNTFLNQNMLSSFRIH
jgi:hypothetical protein